jgi:COP9 signalosome complex subunit 6
MLQSRIQLITAYLESLPPSFTAGDASGGESMDTDVPAPSLPVLRQIQAIISRLDLVVPSDKDTFDKELLQETNDVHLLDLLNAVMQSTSQVRDVGKKYGVVESSKSASRRGAAGEFQAPGPLSLLNTDMYS